MNPIKAIFLMLVRPRMFVRLSIEHDVALEFESNRQLLVAYPDRKLPPDKLKNFEDNARDRTRKIRSAFFAAIWYTVSAITLGLLTGHLIGLLAGKPSPILLSSLQIIAAGIILIATLSLLGWKIQSYKGQSLPEKANRWLFRTQYWIGTYLFVMSFGWTG